MLCAVDFVFHVECAKHFDCKPATVCPVPRSRAAQYRLSGADYPAFVQVMLDRMSLLAPRWTERNPADLGRRHRRGAGLRRRPAELPPRRHRHRGLSRHGAAAHLDPPPCAAGRLPDRRRQQRARLDQAGTFGTICRRESRKARAAAPCSTARRRRHCRAMPRPTARRSPPERNSSRSWPTASSKPIRRCRSPRPLLRDNNMMPLYNWSAEEFCLQIGATAATLAGQLRAEPRRRPDPGRGARAAHRRRRRRRSRQALRGSAGSRRRTRHRPAHAASDHPHRLACR